MMLLALLAAASVQPALPRPNLTVQATATVRIVSGQRVSFGESRPDAQLRRTQFREVGGIARPAQLTEFQ
jgi:hypothetical protein